jgi:hypothetical protein
MASNPSLVMSGTRAKAATGFAHGALTMAQEETRSHIPMTGN